MWEFWEPLLSQVRSTLWGLTVTAKVETEATSSYKETHFHRLERRGYVEGDDDVIEPTTRLLTIVPYL